MLLAFIVPLFVLGAIAWFVVGLLRSKGVEPFTIATATSFYGHLLLISGLVAFLAGGAMGVKVALGRIQAGYSYYVYNNPIGYYGKGGPPADFEAAQVAQDGVLAATLAVIGLLVVGAHLLLLRSLRGTPAAMPRWITHGTLIALTLVTAVAGLGGTVMAIYLTAVYLLVPATGGQPAQPFGDSVGMAVFFLPAWVACMIFLVRGNRPRPAGAAVQTVLAG